jgi:hypothetical protein
MALRVLNLKKSFPKSLKISEMEVFIYKKICTKKTELYLKPKGSGSLRKLKKAATLEVCMNPWLNVKL